MLVAMTTHLVSIVLVVEHTWKSHVHKVPRLVYYASKVLFASKTYYLHIYMVYLWQLEYWSFTSRCMSFIFFPSH